MGYHKVQHIKKLKVSDNATANKAKTHTIGANLSLSANTTVAAQGAIVTGGSNALDVAITADTDAKLASKTATNTKNSKNKLSVEKANAAGIILEQQFPNNPDLYVATGYDVTEEIVPDTVVPGIVLHGSATQGDELGTADVHHDPEANADDYRIYVTKGPVGDRAQYIDVTNTDESTSKSSTTVTLPTDYLNVPLNFIIVAHNTAGDGPDSTPFGGGRRIQ